jgi:hypothetical protein
VLTASLDIFIFSQSMVGISGHVEMKQRVAVFWGVLEQTMPPPVVLLSCQRLGKFTCLVP